MIYIRKTYEDNVNLAENKGYKIVVDNLLETGKIPDKYSILLKEEDYANILVLGLIKAKELSVKEISEWRPIEHMQGQPPGYYWWPQPVPGHVAETELDPNFHWQKFSRTERYVAKHLNEVCSLIDRLSENMQERMMFTLGIRVILDLDLDEIRPIKEVLNRMNAKYSGQQPKKIFYNNITTA